jgi:Ni2+-binding GTPase involved in maturation of urease and hydrogenase
MAGPPSTGMTSVLIHALAKVEQAGLSVAVVKFDCLVSDDADIYQRNGIDALTGLSAGQCPDHFFASNIPAVFRKGREQGVDLLVTESAGLCNRCSPYIEGVPAVCAIDCLAGFGAPKKMGPLLKMADLVLLTKGDLVSQAEREVLAFSVQASAPRAHVLFANGHTGQGTDRLADFFIAAADIDTLDERDLRFSTPSALCSYCLGEKTLGEDHQMGNIRRMVLR